jgi:hypothetical protein
MREAVEEEVVDRTIGGLRDQAQEQAGHLLDRMSQPADAGHDAPLLADDGEHADDINARVVTQRTLLAEETAQDKAWKDAKEEGIALGWKARLQKLRVLEVKDDAKLPLSSRLKESHATYLFFNNLFTSAVSFWDNSGNWFDCCSHDPDDWTVQVPAPAALNCSWKGNIFYATGAAFFGAFCLTGLFFTVPPLVRYTFARKKHVGDKERSLLLKREFKLAMMLYNWAISVPMIWLSLSQSGVEGQTTFLLLVSIHNIAGQIYPIFVQTIGIFFTPLWKFIRDNREARTLLVLMSTPSLVLLPLALCYTFGMSGYGIGIAVVIGIVVGVLLILSLRFLDKDLIHPIVLLLVFAVVVAMDIIYYLAASWNVGYPFIVMPPLFVMCCASSVQLRAIRLNKQRGINQGKAFERLTGKTTRVVGGLFALAFAWFMMGLEFEGVTPDLDDDGTSAKLMGYTIGCCKCQPTSSSMLIFITIPGRLPIPDVKQYFLWHVWQRPPRCLLQQVHRTLRVRVCRAPDSTPHCSTNNTSADATQLDRGQIRHPHPGCDSGDSTLQIRQEDMYIGAAT